MRVADLKFGLIFFAVSLLVKLPYLGTFLTIDERRWIHGAGQFLLALRSGDLAQTYWHFFPGITITWGEAIILWLQSLWASNSMLQEFVDFQTQNLNISVGSMRLSGVVLTSLTLPFLYAFARPLMGRWAAILGTGLLAVDPFWIAHSRIVNGDALAGVLMVAAYISFALLLFYPRQKIAVASGVFVGLSLLTKLPSPIIILCILILAAIGFYKDRNRHFWLKALILCGLTSAAVFVILWPAMWVAPIKTLTLIYEDTFSVGDIGGKDKVDFFMGQVIEKQSNLFYPLALIFRLTPINMIGAALSLALLIFSKNSKSKVVTILLWLFIVIVVLFSNASPKKADRYAISVIVALDLLAGMGWIWLLDQILSLQKINWRITNHYFAIIFFIVIQLIFTITSYPYVLTYYNPLLGGYAKAAELIPVGWGEGLEQAAVWINNQPNAQQATIAPYYDDNVTNYYLEGHSLDWSKDGKKQILADYVVFYINQTQRKLPYPGLVAYFQQKSPAYVVKQGETPYVWVYQREVPITALHGEAEIIGRAQIVGYSQFEARLTPGRSTEIILYFLTKDQPLPDNEDFRVSLVDINGYEHGIWHSVTTHNQWIPDAVVEWKGVLSLPVDIPSGNYKLKISLLDTNTNSDVTFFAFEDEIITVW